VKGLVVISTGDQVQRFLHSSALSRLQAQYDLTYVFPDPQHPRAGIKLDLESLQLPRVAYVPLHEQRHETWTELFHVSCLVYGTSSASFLIRYHMQEHRPAVPLPSLEWRHPRTFGAYVRAMAAHLTGVSRHKWRHARHKKLASPAHYRDYCHRTISSLGLHPQFDALVQQERPDFMVLPSTLLDWLTNDALQIADHYQIPTFLLVSGWDNLSSKGVLFHRPTTVGVWGEQTRRHASDIQRVPLEDVFCLGAPHYEAFRLPPEQDASEIRRRLGLPIDRKIVLFGGSFRQFDETSLLRQIEDAIEDGTLPSIHVLYRPHPWRAVRQGEQSFFDSTWKHVTLDPENVAAYRETKRSGRHIGAKELAFSMRHLNEIYRIVDAAISPMSTLILEAMLFGNPILAIAFSDGRHVWSADKTSQMTHFKEMAVTPGVHFCREADQFIPLLRQVIASADDLRLRESLRQATRFFVLQCESSYAERLEQLVRSRL
jgi:hypothetical protein